MGCLEDTLGWAATDPRTPTVAPYYAGYLEEAHGTITGVLSRLADGACPKDALDPAVDWAHRIKGNAAMYGRAELGLYAERVEATLREQASRPENQLSVETVHETLQGFAARIESTRAALIKSDNEAEAELVIMPTPAPAAVFAPRLRERPRLVVGYADPWIGDLVASMLDGEFEVVGATNPEAVLEAVERLSPDLVVLEDGMGAVSGDGDTFDLLGRLLSHPALPDVYMAFEPGQPERVARALGLGVVGFTEDRFALLELCDFVRGHLARTQPSVLVVDDDPVVRDLLRRILGSAGVAVRTAGDGVEALDMMDAHAPDLVLLDRFMPRLEGGTVLYEMRSRINLKSTPVMILTAMANQGEARSWFERGAADFIPKPFDPDEVLLRVRRQLGAKLKAA